MARFRVLCLSALTCLIFASPASAQRGGNKMIGIQGGATTSDLFGGGVNTNSRWGGTAGIVTAFRASRNTIVTLEGNWVQMGGKGAGGINDTRLDYIEVPLLFGGVYPTYNDGLRFRLYTGIAIQFKVSCKSDDARFNCDRANSPIWAWPFGFMVGRYTESGTFVALDVRYSLGLSDAFSTSFAYNRSWQFRLILGKAMGR